jgi:hypothetical protein
MTAPPQRGHPRRHSSHGSIGRGVYPGEVATGGGSIASAPTVAYGQLEFGNTATDLPANEFANGYCYSWWLVPAITGDKITIDWTSEPDANGAYLTALWAYLYPVGTTDFNFPNTNPVAEKDVNYAVTGLQEL